MNNNKIPKQENEFVEFKTNFSNEVIESLVAFSNKKGGRVFVGVNNSGETHGVTLHKESVNEWLNEIKSKTHPFITPLPEIIKVNGKIIGTKDKYNTLSVKISLTFISCFGQRC